MHLGMGEMLVVLVIAMLVFGPTKLPQLGDALGKGIRNFKQASQEDDPAAEPAQQQLSAGAAVTAPQARTPGHEKV
jgi:sec-independent protein translocase protein TatA